jgi:hypothetical protein
MIKMKEKKQSIGNYHLLSTLYVPEIQHIRLYP